MDIKEVFPYQYVGGGYFRKKGVPEGQKTECLHGMEAVEYVLKRIEELNSGKVEYRNQS